MESDDARAGRIVGCVIWQCWPTSKDHALKSMVASAVTLDGDSVTSSVSLSIRFLVLL